MSKTDEDFNWSRFERNHNINNKRPEKIVGKIPMRNMVFTANDELYEYFFIDGKIYWLLCAYIHREK